MSVCTTAMPFLSSIWTWLGLAGVGVGAKLAYSYSSLSFWPRALALSSIWRTIAVTISAGISVLTSNITKYIATITTFSQTIKYLLTGSFALDNFLEILLFELYDKIVLTVKNIVEGFSLVTKWLSGIDQGGCSLLGSLDVLGSGLLEIWFGAAAFIFILWMWNLTWYDWRNVEMESQEKLLVIGLIAVISIAAHSTELVFEGVSNGVSLADTLTQLGEKWVGSEALNGSEVVNSSSG